MSKVNEKAKILTSLKYTPLKFKRSNSAHATTSAHRDFFDYCSLQILLLTYLPREHLLLCQTLLQLLEGVLVPKYVTL